MKTKPLDERLDCSFAATPYVLFLTKSFFKRRPRKLVINADKDAIHALFTWESN